MPRVTDAHRESRRRQILDASIDCFAREGFHRTSMSHIIAEAGVSTGTIYLYFTSKEEIVEAIAEERHALESRWHPRRWQIRTLVRRSTSWLPAISIGFPIPLSRSADV